MSRRKRQRVDVSIGAPTGDDSPTAHLNNPSSSASSVRAVGNATIPTLTTLCACVFAANLRVLANDPGVWKEVQRLLKVLPDHVVPKLFAKLRDACPTLLNKSMIIAYFLRGTSITLTSELPGVGKDVVKSIKTAGRTLRELELSGFEKLPDELFASILPSLMSLRVLVLRGCTKVGPKTAAAAAQSCPDLTTVNFSYTAVTPVSLLPLIQRCQGLEVLKLAGLSNWSDNTFQKLIAGLAGSLLPNLHKLKLRETSLSSTSIHSLLSFTPNLQGLDVSFTPILHGPLSLPQIPPLEKLVLTRTAIPAVDLLTVVEHLPLLKTLRIGALGGRTGNSSAMTMNDTILINLSVALAKHHSLEDVSLAGNIKLGTDRSYEPSSMAAFVRGVGRRCKVLMQRLNLSNIPALRSEDISTLLPADALAPPPALEVLILSNTSVSDDAAPYISTCVHLKTLKAAGTKFTNEGLYPIVDACEYLEELDLTSCRGVSVADRRRFFEAWKERRGQ